MKPATKTLRRRGLEKLRAGCGSVSPGLAAGRHRVYETLFMSHLLAHP